MIGQRRDDFLKDPFTCEEQNHLIAANWRVYKFWWNRLKAAEVLKAAASVLYSNFTSSGPSKQVKTTELLYFHLALPRC